MLSGFRPLLGASRQLVLDALDGRFALLLSTPLLVAYESVLRRPQHLTRAGATVAEVTEILDALAGVCVPVVFAFNWRPFNWLPTGAHADDEPAGNTLAAVETTLVVEQGLTIGGKPLRDHLEAIDHYEAIRYVRAMARLATPVTEMDVRNLHRLVVLRSLPESAGRYADQGRFVLTDAGRHAFPSPAEVPR